MQTAIYRFVDAALRIWSVSVSQGTHVDDTRVLGINHDPANLASVLQPQVGPRVSAIHRLVNAVARGEIGTNVGLTRSCINGVGVRGSNRECADRPDTLGIKNRRPHDTAVGCFPDATIYRSKIEGRGVARHPSHRDDSSSTKGPDQSPLKPVKQVRRNGLGNRRDGESKKEQCKKSMRQN
jgi:hypothetical protein